MFGAQQKRNPLWVNFRQIFLLFLIGIQGVSLVAQQFPSEEENIPYLITFGKNSQTKWGDDDFEQTFFMLIPETHKTPVYFRVFDPEIGGQGDEQNGAFDTETRFAVYGGKESYSHPEARGLNPTGHYDSGTLLGSKAFKNEATYDQKWFTFGPFNPTEGEYVPAFKGYVFKIIAEGISGDDGNAYRYFISTRPQENMPIEGANAFTFEYTFRMPDGAGTCHIYPFIDDQAVSIQQYNFDWDGDGLIRIVSVARKGEQVKLSTDDNWAVSKHEILDRERNSSLDIQLVRTKMVRNNNVVLRVTNQYGESTPFFSIPIGGRPVYKPIIQVVPHNP